MRHSSRLRQVDTTGHARAPRPVRGRVVGSLTAAALIGTGLIVAAGATAAADGRPVGGSGSMYYLNDAWTSTANREFAYGQANDQVYVGNWDGKGGDSLAVRRDNQYYLSNSFGGAAETVVAYGRPDDIVLVGDWDGNGTDTPAVRRGNEYHIKNSWSSGPADKVVGYGRADDVVLVGDWDGNGTDTPAVRRGSTYHIKNSWSAGPADQQVPYGRQDDVVVVGNWDGVGGDSLAVRRGNRYFIANAIRSGEADKVLDYGRATDTVLAGDWDGNGTDTLGVRRPAAPAAPVTPNWYTQAYGTFTTRTYTGVGRDVVMLAEPVRAFALTATHNGRSNFIVHANDISGETVGYAVNEIGSYSGTVGVGLEAYSFLNPIQVLDVQADGQWSLTVAPISSIPKLTQLGSGPGVYKYDGVSQIATFTHNGQSNFIVHQYTGSSSGVETNYLINAIGAFTGRAQLRAGPSIVEITADGTWTVG